MELGVTTGQVEGDVVHPADRPFSHKAVVVEHGAHEGGLGLIEIDRDVGVAHGGCSGIGSGWGGLGRGRLGLGLGGLGAGFGGGLRGRCGFRSRGAFRGSTHRSGAHDPNAAAIARDRLHQRLEPVEGHGEAALGLPLPADPIAFNHNREQATVGSAGLVCGNAHAVVAP